MLPINSAAYRVGSPENLPHHAREVDGIGAWSHNSKIRERMKTRGSLYPGAPAPFVPSSMVDILHCDVSIMLDILHLLAVSVWLLKSLYNKSSG